MGFHRRAEGNKQLEEAVRLSSMPLNAGFEPVKKFRGSIVNRSGFSFRTHANVVVAIRIVVFKSCHRFGRLASVPIILPGGRPCDPFRP